MKFNKLKVLFIQISNEIVKLIKKKAQLRHWKILKKIKLRNNNGKIKI